MQGKTHCSCSGSFYAIHALSGAADTAEIKVDTARRRGYVEITTRRLLWIKF